MSNTDFLEVSIVEQDDGTQQYNLVKKLINSFQFSSSVWAPLVQIPTSLVAIDLPINPVTLMYIRNIGKINIGMKVSPITVAPSVAPAPVITESQALSLLGPGDFSLLLSSNLFGASMVNPGGLPAPPPLPLPTPVPADIPVLPGTVALPFAVYFLQVVQYVNNFPVNKSLESVGFAAFPNNATGLTLTNSAAYIPIANVFYRVFFGTISGALNMYQDFLGGPPGIVITNFGTTGTVPNIPSLSPFPINVSGGYNGLSLQTSSNNPADLGQVEFFLAG